MSSTSGPHVQALCHGVSQPGLRVPASTDTGRTDVRRRSGSTGPCPREGWGGSGHGLKIHVFGMPTDVGFHYQTVLDLGTLL